MLVSAAACANRSDDFSALQQQLEQYAATKDARIGVAVIINGRDTVSVNGELDFPMMSVFKFPLALAVAQWADAHAVAIDSVVTFSPSLLMPDTYSPMLKKYGPALDRISLRELLEWSLMESDNNAADVLLDRVGGPDSAIARLKEVAGTLPITIGASERDMHADQAASNLNCSTPLAMAALFDRFDQQTKHSSKTFSEIAVMLEGCRTGADRLAVPLQGSDAVIGHKTGTGFETANGGISAINDCGYVHLPDGTRYAIAVFVANSPYGADETAKIIADISEIVLNALTNKK